MVSVDEYAKWRGISVQRVRDLLRAGDIPGHRVGPKNWVIDDVAYVSRKRLGRPMSPRIAWAVIAVLGGDEPDQALSPKELSRVRDYRNQVVHSTEAPALLSSWLRHRGERLVFRAHADDVADLADDARVLRSGVSDPRSGLGSGDFAELWLREFDSLDDVRGDYLLLPDLRGNVVVHRGRSHPEQVAQLGLVIADLADWNGPREDGRVNELLASLR